MSTEGQHFNIKQARKGKNKKELMDLLQVNMIPATDITRIVSDLWSFQLSIVGIAVSMMTLLFASHVGKAEAFQHVSKSKDINSEYLSIYLSNGIKTYKQLNSKIVAILILSGLLFLYTTITKYISNECVLFWMCIVDVLLTFTLAIWAVCVMIKVYRQYRKDTN